MEQSTVVDYPDGWKCGHCGQWVSYGNFHICATKEINTYLLTSDSQLDRVEKLLKEILEILKKDNTQY